MPLQSAIEVIKSMGKHSNLSFKSQITHSGWKDVPVSWILTELDFIISPDVQRGYIETIERETGRKVDLHIMATGHSPTATKPEEVAAILLKIVQMHE
jgi:hypothetical protein